jgi:hypothetical protein
MVESGVIPEYAELLASNSISIGRCQDVCVKKSQTICAKPSQPIPPATGSRRSGAPYEFPGDPHVIAARSAVVSLAKQTQRSASPSF